LSPEHGQALVQLQVLLGQIPKRGNHRIIQPADHDLGNPRLAHY
jgi:hypothetical protein